MDANDWDAVPQPLRMIAFPMMLEYWTACYGLSESSGVAAVELTATLSAIVMAESWFDHRAWFENQWGNRDIGLGPVPRERPPRQGQVLQRRHLLGDVDRAARLVAPDRARSAGCRAPSRAGTDGAGGRAPARQS
jgi:hypothetical protein